MRSRRRKWTISLNKRLKNIFRFWVMLIFWSKAFCYGRIFLRSRNFKSFRYCFRKTRDIPFQWWLDKHANIWFSEWSQSCYSKNFWKRVHQLRAYGIIVGNLDNEEEWSVTCDSGVSILSIYNKCYWQKFTIRIIRPSRVRSGHC